MYVCTHIIYIYIYIEREIDRYIVFLPSIHLGYTLLRTLPIALFMVCALLRCRPVRSFDGFWQDACADRLIKGRFCIHSHALYMLMHCTC